MWSFHVFFDRNNYNNGKSVKNFLNGMRSALNIAGENIEVKLGTAADDARANLSDWREVGDGLRDNIAKMEEGMELFNSPYRK